MENQKNFLNNLIEETHIIYQAQELIQHLICPICRGLIREPILSCQKCTSYGCGVCIEAWDNQGKNRCLNGCKDPQFKKLTNPILKTVLDNIQIKCPSQFNEIEKERCTKILNYNNFLKHLDECEYKIVKCIYSSCMKKGIQREILIHQETCKLKNPHIYFIYRDYEKIPIKIEIALNEQDKLDKFLDELSLKVNVNSKNIEFLMLKNHEIIEYLSNLDKPIKYLQTHEGFIFGFQKYPEDKFFKMQKNPRKECQIHLELLIVDNISKFKQDFLRIHNQEIQRCPSFTRIIHCEQSQSFKQIHLEIFKLFKPYLKNWYQKKSQEASENILEINLYFSQFNFQIQNDDQIIQKELEYTFNQKEKFDPPYQLVFGENMKQELPYVDKSFNDYYKLDENNETQFILALILASYLSDEISSLKLNRCHEANFKIGYCEANQI